MSTALGVLKWTPDTFWKSTLNEWRAGMKGHMSTLGDVAPPPMQKEELEDAWAVHEKRMKASGRGH